MKVGKIPVGMDPIEAKKKVGSFLRTVQNDSKSIESTGFLWA